MKPKQSDIHIPQGSPDLFQDTIRFWEKRLGTQVTQEEAREMIENVVGYFSLLAEWDSTEKDRT